MSCNATHSLRKQRRADILACAPGIIFAHRGFDTNGQIARHLGLSTAGLRAHVSNEAELVRVLCHTHLDALFHAVCQANGPEHAPENALHAMAEALLAGGRAHAARHRIYLLHRFMLAEAPRNALRARRAHIDNRFHFALHAIAPAEPFCAVREPARLFVGQLLHAPLWWPADTKITQSDWLSREIGAMAARPHSPCTRAKTVA